MIRLMGIGACALLALCAQGAALAAAAAQPPDSLTWESLSNATYAIEYVPDSPVTLTEGVYQNTADQVYVELQEDVAYGDMTGGGVDDAAALLASNMGGSGVFMELVLMTDADGAPQQLASTLLGDRVNVQSVTIEEQTTVVHMIQQGPDDAMCCPTQEVTQTYALDGSELVLVSEEVADSEAAELTDEALATATFSSEYVDGAEVTLVDGLFESAPQEGAGDSGVSIRLAPEWTAFGDLNGDGVDDAVALLVTSTGGTGVFNDLAVFVNVNGSPSHVATAYLGDRVGIEGITIDEGAVVVEMIEQGPDEPMCCPTQRVLRTFRLTEDGLALVSDEYAEAEVAVAGTASLQGFDPEAAATSATLNAGASESGGLDPALVSVLSGVVGGQHVEASLLGDGCAGVISAAPDVAVNWQPGEQAEALRFFTLSTGDPTLLVLTPDGSILCNDDFSPLLLDSLVTVESPQPGRYAVYVGSFEGQAVAPALLVVTSHDTNAGSFDIGALAPRPAAAAVALERLPASTLEAASESEAMLIRGSDTPYTSVVQAGGPIGVFNVDVGNELCTGFVTAAPTFSFRWLSRAQNLNLYFEGQQDSTLIVRDPNGTFQCIDDVEGANNLNPQLILSSIPGIHDVWIGSFAPDVTIEGVLTINEDVEAGPATLRPDDGEEAN